MSVPATSGKDTAAVHTPHDTDAPPIRHAHPPITYPNTWLGELYRHAERLSDVRVPRGLLGLTPPDEPICPRDWHDNIRVHAARQTKDDAWRYLVRQVITQTGNWHLYAIGAMVPGLTGVTLQIAPSSQPREVIDQAYRDVIGQFLVAIQDLAANPTALAAPYVPNRLLGRAFYHATTRFQADQRLDEFDEHDDYDARRHGRLRRRPRGHPDFVLAAMIEHTKNLPDGQKLTDTDSELVARSRMEYIGLGPSTRRKTIADAAAELGIEVPAAGMRRWRAEVLIARMLHAHERGYRVPAAAIPRQRQPEQAQQPSA